MRFALAGARDIAVWVLEYLLASGCRPEALLLSGPADPVNGMALEAMCGHLGPDRIFRGQEFREPETIEALRRLDLDLIVSIHFPFIVPPELLAVPRHGVVNLHPAYLPYNRGWHTPTWALLEDLPIGATLHFMNEEIDSGDIVHQRRLDPSAGDTAHTLYEKLKRLEVIVFTEAWPRLMAGDFSRIPQNPCEGTLHVRRDLSRAGVQRIRLDETVRAGDLLRRLRALTTNRVDEAAYYQVDGRRYRVQLMITEEPADREDAPADA